jgi:hypothetical protein
MKYLAFLIIGIIAPAMSRGQASNPSSLGSSSGGFQAQGNLPSLLSSGSNSQSPSGIPEPSTGLDGFVWDGKKFTLGDVRILNAKFVGYLNEPEEGINEEKSYQEDLAKILDSLDVFRVRADSKAKILQEILPPLKKAMRNPRDGGQCRAIYNAIGTDFHGRDDIAGTNMRIRELSKEIEKIRWNMKVTANPSTMSIQSNPFHLDGVRVDLQSLQADLEAKTAELKSLSEHTQTKVSESRISLQRVIVNLFLSRHFDHVMIATSIYRFLYTDGAGGIEIEDSVISAASESAKKMRAATSYDRSVKTDNTIGYSSDKGAYSNNVVQRNEIENGIVSILPGMSEVLDKQTSLKLAVLSNIPKEMTELESVTQEVVDQTNRMMKSVQSLMSQGLFEEAMQRLQEALLAGEHLSSLRTFSCEKRQNLWSYLQKKRDVLASISSKDYAVAAKKIEEMKGGSKDSPFVKELAEIKNLQGSSDMYIAKSKESASRGDSEGMNKALEEAAKIWPQNPALSQTTEQLSKLNQGKDELKKLLEQKNFKYIMDEKAKFLAVASDDPALLDKLKHVLEQEGKALSWKTRVEELLKRNDPYGAWEEAEKGIVEHPESNDLMKLRSDAAVKCPDFVDKIEKARNATVRQDPAAALAAYLVARQIYPQSALAREGIDTLSKQLLSK